MSSLTRRLVRITVLTTAVFTVYMFGCFIWNQTSHFARPKVSLLPFDSKKPTGTRTSKIRTTSSLSLNEEECSAAFPGLTKDIDETLERGHFSLERANDDYQGLVQGRIHDGKLYIISAAPDKATQMITERTAVLHQLHKALLTSPSPLPNTHFAFCINDHPKNNSWVFAKPNKPSSLNTWLMPHFSFWSWPIPQIGTMDDALTKIKDVENEIPWEKKNDKAIWRGTPWFNPIGNQNLRPGLVKTAEGKSWADVQSLVKTGAGENRNEPNALRIEEFCKYKYIIYTEGVTYSGRLPYHQACASILITPPLTYLQHTSYLIRPIAASSLLSTTSSTPPPKVPNNPLISTTSNPDEANAIYVSPDWSDLEPIIHFLRQHPQLAKGIAKRSRETVVRSGWLSPAAEMCYWRSVIRAWAGVVEIDDGKGEGGWRGDKGTRFETWILKTGGR